MASPSRIAALAALIQKNTAILDDYMTANGIPTPSFDESYPPVVQLPKDMADVRDAILEATDEMHSLLMDPVTTIYNEIAKVPQPLSSPVFHPTLAKTPLYSLPSSSPPAPLPVCTWHHPSHKVPRQRLTP